MKTVTAEDITGPTTRGAPPKAIELAWKFARMLGLGSIPDIVVRNNLTSKWLGRIHFGGPGERNPRNLMELQKNAFHDERTLSRIVAHEMCHHGEFLLLQKQGFKPTKFYRRFNPAHGSEWQKFADKVNRVMGADFVTVVSDALVSRGELSPKTGKKYLMRISWVGDRPAYAIAAKLTPKVFDVMARGYAYEQVTKKRETRYILLDDATWTQGQTPSIGTQKIAIPSAPEVLRKLAELYDKASPLEVMYPLVARGSR